MKARVLHRPRADLPLCSLHLVLRLGQNKIEKETKGKVGNGKENKTRQSRKGGKRKRSRSNTSPSAEEVWRKKNHGADWGGCARL
jgi:hypothetical protein